tara:strand:- start:331 stop:999 length:669 start_codon:yes stop_codon:yes gene_type:complete
MTLTSSGTLSYNTIRAEFGSSSSNVKLSLYVRGGQYTPSVPENANITTSSTGEIAVNDFYGAGGNTNYAWGTGGSYTTGGKAPITYTGIGGPSLPASFNSGTMKVGSATTTISKFYSNTDLGGFQMTFANVTGRHNSNWTSRTFTAYNLATTAVFQITTSNYAGSSTLNSGNTQPDSNGNYSRFNDTLSGINQSGFVFPSEGGLNGNSAGAGLGAYFSLKAF